MLHYYTVIAAIFHYCTVSMHGVCNCNLRRSATKMPRSLRNCQRFSQLFIFIVTNIIYCGPDRCLLQTSAGQVCQIMVFITKKII